jgi:hypothetical protein
VFCEHVFDQGGDGFVFDPANGFELCEGCVVGTERNFSAFPCAWFFQIVHDAPK